MEKIKTNLEKYKIAPSKITNERQSILKEFLDRLNLDRKPPYKPLSPARLGFMMRFMTTQQMKFFLGDCKYANNFSKYFWWKYKK